MEQPERAPRLVCARNEGVEVSTVLLVPPGSRGERRGVNGLALGVDLRLYLHLGHSYDAFREGGVHLAVAREGHRLRQGADVQGYFLPAVFDGSERD